jgi:hypothetical protein
MYTFNANLLTVSLVCDWIYEGYIIYSIYTLLFPFGGEHRISCKYIGKQTKVFLVNQ